VRDTEDFEVIFTSENSNKFPKTRFRKEESVQEVVTLGPMGTGHTPVFIERENGNSFM
jgi:hypothetical protein